MSTDDWIPSNGPDDGASDRTTRLRGERPDHGWGSPDALESVVVGYENGPDRCTIYPRDCPEAEKVTTWLSANLSAFVDLEHAR